MALRAFWQQENIFGRVDRIEIHDSEFSGTAFQFEGDEAGFSFRHDQITSESSDKLINIQKNRVQVGKLDFRPRIVDSQGFTLLEDIRDFSSRFHIVHKIDGDFEWCGNITTKVFRYPEKESNFVAQLRATDFEILQGGNDYALDDDRQPYITTLVDLFSDLPEDVPIKTATSWTEQHLDDDSNIPKPYDFLAEIYHDTKALREFGNTGDETDQPISKFEAVERLAECGLLIRQLGGHIMIDQLTELADPTDVHETIYNADGTVDTATRSIDRTQTGYASTEDGLPSVKATSQNDTYPAVDRARTTFAHRSKVSGLLLPSAVYLSNNEDQSFSNAFIATGNEEISLSANVFVRHSTDEDGAYAEIRIRVGQYYFNGTNWVEDNSAVVTVELTGDGQQTEFDGPTEDYYQYNGFVSITTPSVPSDATSPVEVTFLNGLVEANPDEVADRTIYENISYSVTDPGNTEENSTSIHYQLSQTGVNYPTAIDLGDTHFGDWARGTAAALRYSIANTNLTSNTWRRRGQTIPYRLFHANLLKEVLDMGRTNMRKLEAQIWGDYDPSRILDYKGNYFYYAGGKYDGTRGRWQVTLMELNLQTDDTDDFQDVPKFSDSGGGTGGTAGGGNSLSIEAIRTQLDPVYFGQSENLSEGDPSAMRGNLGLGDLATQDTINNDDWSGAALEIANGGTGATNDSDARANLGLQIDQDVQAHDAQLDTLSGFSAGQVAHLDSIDQDLGTTDEPIFPQMTINNAPTANDEVATKGYADSLINGLDWQESVLDEINDPSTVTPSSGDRYLVGESPVGDFSGHAEEIAEYDGSSWSFISPDDATTLEIESNGFVWIWNGSNWVRFGSSISHNQLQDLDASDHLINENDQGIAFYNASQDLLDTSSDLTFDGSVLETPELTTHGVLTVNEPSNSPSGAQFLAASPGGDLGFVFYAGDGSGGQGERWNQRVTASEFIIENHSSSNGVSISTNGAVGLDNTLTGVDADFSSTLDVGGVSTLSDDVILGNQATSSNHALRADRTLQFTSDSALSFDNETARNLTTDLSWALSVSDHGSGQRGVLNTSAQTIYGSKTLENALTYNSSITSESFDNDAGIFTGFDLGQNEFKAETIRANELRVKAFVAEISAALYGEDILTKSRGVLSRGFTVPAVGNTSTLYVEDLEGQENTQVFEANDWVRLRVVDRSGGGLNVFNVWGKVTSYSDLSGGEQSWTFTRESGGSASDGDIVYEGSVAIDYGTSGDAVIVRSVIGDNTPRDTQLTWTSNPIDAGNYSIVTRTGILDDIDYASGSGFYGENQYLTGSLLAGDLSKGSDGSGNYIEYDGTNINVFAGNAQIGDNSGWLGSPTTLSYSEDTVTLADGLLTADGDAQTLAISGAGASIDVSDFDLSAGSDYWRTSDNTGSVGDGVLTWDGNASEVEFAAFSANSNLLSTTSNDIDVELGAGVFGSGVVGFAASDGTTDNFAYLGESNGNYQLRIRESGNDLVQAGSDVNFIAGANFDPDAMWAGASSKTSTSTTFINDWANQTLQLGPDASSITATSNTGIYLDGTGVFNFAIDSSNYIRNQGSQLRIETDYLKINTTNFALDTVAETMSLGNVFSADGSDNEGTLASASIDDRYMWGITSDRIDSPFVVDFQEGLIDLTDSADVGLKLRSGAIPEIEMKASNGDLFHIGGGFSFDGEDDVYIERDSFSPSIPATDPSESDSGSSGDTHTYDISDYQDRFLRLSVSISAEASSSQQGDAAGAYADIEVRILDGTGGEIVRYYDEVDISVSDTETDSGSGAVSVSRSVPSNAATVELTWSVSCSTDGSLSSSSASIDFSDPVGVIIGEQEFLSPRGLQMTNQSVTGQEAPPRVRLRRDNGRVLGHLVDIEGPSGQLMRFRINDNTNEIELYDVNADSVRNSWPAAQS